MTIIDASGRFDWFVAHVRAGTLDEAMVAEGFAPPFLEAVPAEQIVAVAMSVRDQLSADPDFRQARGSALMAKIGDVVVVAQVEPVEPHRFTGLTLQPAPRPIDDERLRRAPWTSDGDGSAPVELLKTLAHDNGLVGVVAAGFRDDGRAHAWTIAGGYADLDAERAVAFDERMLAGSISKLPTAIAALRLVAEGTIGLDDRANDHLRSLRIASDDVTIRQLLTHTAGVSSAFEHFTEVVGEPRDVLGDDVAVDFEPGSRWEYSNGGYTVLGEVLAGVEGRPADEVITERVLRPLGMASSTFARRWPDDVGPGYGVDADGHAAVQPSTVPSVLAPGGMVTTVADLGRLVAGWRGLLPDDLADAAITPQVTVAEGRHQGFGWVVSTLGGRRLAGHAGGVLAGSSSLLWLPDTGEVTALLTNRAGIAETVNVPLLRAHRGG